MPTLAPRRLEASRFPALDQAPAEEPAGVPASPDDAEVMERGHPADAEDVQEPPQEAEITPPPEPVADWRADPVQVQRYFQEVEAQLEIQRPLNDAEFREVQRNRAELALQGDAEMLVDVVRNEMVNGYRFLTEVAQQQAVRAQAQAQRQQMLVEWDREFFTRHPDLKGTEELIAEHFALHGVEYNPKRDGSFGISDGTAHAVQDKLASAGRAKIEKIGGKSMPVTRPSPPAASIRSATPRPEPAPVAEPEPGDPGYEPKTLAQALKAKRAQRRRAAAEGV